VDNEAPVITNVSVNPQDLGAPNHKMRDVHVSYTATDNCAGVVTTSLAVISNEPVNGTGDGDTAPDWEINGPHHLKLRAERSGQGNGRIYTITITATDAAGNSSASTANVYVSKGNKSSANSRAGYVTEAEGWEGIPEGLKARVLPNPSTGYFTLLLQSRSDEAVQLRVSDATGRVVENKRGLAANSKVEVGHHYRPGVYHAELIQGNHHILLKLVKQ
jgi:hypothetical protein